MLSIVNYMNAEGEERIGNDEEEAYGWWDGARSSTF